MSLEHTATTGALDGLGLFVTGFLGVVITATGLCVVVPHLGSGLHLRVGRPM